MAIHLGGCARWQCCAALPLPGAATPVWLRSSEAAHFSDVCTITFCDGHDPELCVATRSGRILLRVLLTQPAPFALTPACDGGAFVVAAAVEGRVAGQPRQVAFALRFPDARPAVEVAAVLRAVNLQAFAAANLPGGGSGNGAVDDAGGGALLLQAVQGDPEAFGKQLWGPEFEQLVEAVERAWS